jgi:hypothetical protein
VKSNNKCGASRQKTTHHVSLITFHFHAPFDLHRPLGYDPDSPKTWTNLSRLKTLGMPRLIP